MNIRNKLLLIFIILLSSQNICAQTETRVGFLPSINYNHKINKLYEVNFKLDDNASQDNNFKYDYSLSDISALVGRKVGLNSKVVLGILTRLEPDAVSYRTIQQFIFQTKIEGGNKQ